MDTFIRLIDALAAVAAAAFGAMALVISQRANKLASESSEDNKRFQEEEREKDEEERRNAVAMSVYAYWAKRSDGKWGVVLTNSGPRASVVNNFEVEVQFTEKGALCRESRKLVVLPAGEFFIEHTQTKYGWGDLVTISDNERFTPMVYAAKWRVNRISFVDHFNEQWTYTPEDGYRHRPVGQG